MEGRMDGQSPGIVCRECVDLLGDYVDGTLAKHQAELLEWHLEACAPCVAFVNTYRGTVDAARRLRQATMPPELHQRLIAFLKGPGRQ
jgi:anti-sigma factor RsiW